MLNIRDGKYHKDVYFPDCINKEIEQLLYNLPSEISISKHCRENIINAYHKKKNSYDRRYNTSDIDIDFLKRAKCFEVYVSDCKIIKAAFRGNYGFKKDLSVVIGFTDKMKTEQKLSCITAWINLDSDKRNDFKKSLYIKNQINFKK